MDPWFRLNPMPSANPGAAHRIDRSPHLRQAYPSQRSSTSAPWYRAAT
jgi:hypothetical protein